MDCAAPERLGELVRALLPDHPDLDVLVGARSLETVPAGSTFVLAPRPEDATWLNLNRPLFSRRKLRAVLWCDRDTSIALAQKAPDFFDWISQRVECPPGPATHVVEAIRAAAAAGAPGIVWRGATRGVGGEEEEGETTARLEAAFVAALPGKRLAWVAAERDHEDLLSAVRSAGEAWIACPFESNTALRRFRWALAECGREGRAIAVGLNPRVPCPGWWRVEDRQLEIEHACTLLAEAGASRPGRLAALLDLAPDAVQDAAERLRGGATPEQVEDRARQPRQPVPEPAGRPVGWESIEAELRRGIRRARGWENVALQAAVLGDASAASAWARKAMEAASWRAPLLARQTRRLAERGDVDRVLAHHLTVHHQRSNLLLAACGVLFLCVILAQQLPLALTSGWRRPLGSFVLILAGAIVCLYLGIRIFIRMRLIQRVHEWNQWEGMIEQLLESEDRSRVSGKIERVLATREPLLHTEHPLFRELLSHSAARQLSDGRPRMALETLARAIALEGMLDGVGTPFFVAAVVTLARAYSDTGVPRTAIALLRKVLGATPLDDLPPQPDDLDPTVALPFLEGEEGRAAERYLRRFLRGPTPARLAPEARDAALRALGEALRRQGRHAEADLVTSEPPPSGERSR